MILFIFGSYQVPCIAHGCKLAFGSVPNVSNYGYMFCTFCEDWVNFIHIWYSNQVPCVADECNIM